MTQTGRRFADEAAPSQDAPRRPSRALEEEPDVEQEQQLGSDEAFAVTRRPRKLVLLAAPLVALGVAGASLALTRPDQEPIQAAPQASNSQQVKRSIAPNRDAQRPTLTPRPSSVPSVTMVGALAGGAKAGSVTPRATASVSATSTKPSSATSSSATSSTTVKAPALGEVIGTRYTVKAANLRSQPSTSSQVLEVLATGTKLRITAVTSNGFRQVEHEGGAAWVSESLLVKTRPAVESSSSGGGASSSGGISFAPCSVSSSIESGITFNAKKVYRAVCAKWPQVSSYGGWRPSNDYHGSGRAVDIMITGDTGWQIANWLRANASELGVIEIIYQQKIWTTQRSGEGWRHMSDRGSATANHYDHVHVSVS